MGEKILTKHPGGKQGVNIDREKYETIKTAIIEVLEKGGEVTFKDLTKMIKKNV